MFCQRLSWMWLMLSALPPVLSLWKTRGCTVKFNDEMFSQLETKSWRDLNMSRKSSQLLWGQKSKPQKKQSLELKNQLITCRVFVSRDCTGHEGADAELHRLVPHRHLGGDGGHEVHHLYGRTTGAEGQGGAGWRGHLHHCRSEFIQCTHNEFNL